MQNTFSFFFSSSASQYILLRLQFLRKDYLIIFDQKNIVLTIINIYFQRMSKLQQKSCIFNNLEKFKTSYKVTPPQEISWGALGSQLKIQQINSIEPSIEQHTWTQEISSNPFIKTKQLFKNKNTGNSVIEDDLTNQHIFTAGRFEGQVAAQEGRNFEFDSFGVHQNNQQPKLTQQYPSVASSQDIKAWNSSSVEINFGKIQKEELVLPEPEEKQPQNDFMYNILDHNDSSIKQFCFKLNDTSSISIEKTPIKKWSDIKRNQQIDFQRSQIKQTDSKKVEIKKIITDFMQKLDKIPAESISEQFVRNTKDLLDNFCQKEQGRMPLRERINESLQTSKRKNNQVEDEGSTLRLYTQESSSIRKTQRREKTQHSQYQYKGKFRVYECHSKAKENKTTPIKSQKKVVNKEKRFKF